MVKYFRVSTVDQSGECFKADDRLWKKYQRSVPELIENSYKNYGLIEYRRVRSLDWPTRKFKLY